jgi:hypothetical protein
MEHPPCTPDTEWLLATSKNKVCLKRIVPVGAQG